MLNRTRWSIKDTGIERNFIEIQKDFYPEFKRNVWEIAKKLGEYFERTHIPKGICRRIQKEGDSGKNGEDTERIKRKSCKKNLNNFGYILKEIWRTFQIKSGIDSEIYPGKILK